MLRKSPTLLSPNAVAYLLTKRLIIHDPRNKNVLVHLGKTLTLNDSQAERFSVLYENFLQGNLPIPQRRIMAGWRGQETHLSHIFRGHWAWKNIIVGDGRGHYWINFPKAVLRQAEQSTLQHREDSMSSRSQPDSCSAPYSCALTVDSLDARNEATSSTMPHQEHSGVAAPHGTQSSFQVGQAQDAALRVSDPLHRRMGSLETFAVGYRVIDIKEAAQFANVSKSHMFRAAHGQLVNTPPLPHFTVGRRMLTRTDWLDEWMKAAAAAADIAPQSKPAVLR